MTSNTNSGQTYINFGMDKLTKSNDQRFGCKECDNSCITPDILHRHVMTKHDSEMRQTNATNGVLYRCDEYNYKTSKQSVLTQHKQAQHEGVMYSCDQCHYKATQKGKIKAHKQSQHEVSLKFSVR